MEIGSHQGHEGGGQVGVACCVFVRSDGPRCPWMAGLHGDGRHWVGMMIDAPPGESSVLVLILNISMQRTIRLKASNDVTGRRVDIGLGKGARGAAKGGERGTGVGRRGADVAMGRGGGGSSDVVGEEKREGVGEGSGGQGAGVTFRVEVIEEKGRTDGGWRQAEEG